MSYRPLLVLETQEITDILKHDISFVVCLFQTANGVKCSYKKLGFRVRVSGVARISAGVTIRYDTRCYFNVRSKADKSQLNLTHGNDN